MTTQTERFNEESFKAWSKTEKPLHEKIKFQGNKPIIEISKNFIIEYKNLGVN